MFSFFMPKGEKEFSFSNLAFSRDTAEKLFDFRPAAIIKRFDLRRPIYCQTAAYGHMGREDIDLPWEKTDMAEALSKAFN